MDGWMDGRIHGQQVKTLGSLFISRTIEASDFNFGVRLRDVI